MLCLFWVGWFFVFVGVAVLILPQLCLRVELCFGAASLFGVRWDVGEVFSFTSPA